LALTAGSALVAAPALAQGMGGGKHHHAAAAQTATKPKADDSAYKNALTTMPDKHFDPWGEVRPAAVAGHKTSH
jgi:hypothetical protein